MSISTGCPTVVHKVYMWVFDNDIKRVNIIIEFLKIINFTSSKIIHSTRIIIPIQNKKSIFFVVICYMCKYCLNNGICRFIVFLYINSFTQCWYRTMSKENFNVLDIV